MAPPFISLRAADAYSKEGLEAMAAVNKEFEGYTKVVPSGRATHFFDAFLTISYLDFLKLVFRQRRAELVEQYGHKWEDLGGCLIWDAFAGHACSHA